ncbi:hypothetical protein [Acidocella sp.]|jgi:hypothetical protein|uniref:hypothetical protein n=1 Tax=Acidocella sp. TaxID=50710 RepID=UPI002F3E87AD
MVLANPSGKIPYAQLEQQPIAPYGDDGPRARSIIKQFHELPEDEQQRFRLRITDELRRARVEDRLAAQGRPTEAGTVVRKDSAREAKIKANIWPDASL